MVDCESRFWRLPYSIIPEVCIVDMFRIGKRTVVMAAGAGIAVGCFLGFGGYLVGLFEGLAAWTQAAFEGAFGTAGALMAIGAAKKLE
jgi:hypothetical protein